jgi:polysaccharide pyruvyl transferase WcaK-like protein
MSKDTYQKLPLYHFAKDIVKIHAKKRTRAVIFGNFGACNLGDEAILAGELSELNKIPNLTVTVCAKYPKEVKRLHNVHAISHYAFREIRREIKRSDFIIIGGGGLLNKHERGLIGLMYQLYMLYTFFYLPRRYKKKVYILGIGAYNNTAPLILNLASWLMKSAQIITVRDQNSYETLKQKNVRVNYCKDNSFLMEMVPVKKVLADPYFKRLFTTNKVNIGISLVKPDSKRSERQLIHELTNFINKTHQNADFWFYSADYHPAYFNDEKFGHKLHENIQKKVGKDVKFHFIPTNWDPQLFFSSFKLMNFFITMRLHTSIFAYRSGLSFYGISYDKKCSSFLKSIGMAPHEINQVTSKSIQETFRKAIT